MIIFINEHEVDIDVFILGKYYPPTRTEPAEYPEIEIQSVIVFGKALLKGKPLTRVKENQFIQKYQEDILETIAQDS
mgnify:CR=1 FL=1